MLLKTIEGRLLSRTIGNWRRKLAACRTYAKLARSGAFRRELIEVTSLFLECYLHAIVVLHAVIFDIKGDSSSSSLSSGLVYSCRTEEVSTNAGSLREQLRDGSSR
jgi:hypothetical protein